MAHLTTTNTPNLRFYCDVYDTPDNMQLHMFGDRSTVFMSGYANETTMSTAMGYPEHMRSSQVSLGKPTSLAQSRSRGRKRERTSYTRHQLEILHGMFEKNIYPDSLAREEIARHIGVSESKIQVWFKNRRQKCRKELKDAKHLGEDAASKTKNGTKVMTTSEQSPLPNPMSTGNAVTSEASYDASRTQSADNTRMTSSTSWHPTTSYAPWGPEVEFNGVANYDNNYTYENNRHNVNHHQIADNTRSHYRASHYHGDSQVISNIHSVCMEHPGVYNYSMTPEVSIHTKQNQQDIDNAIASYLNNYVTNIHSH